MLQFERQNACPFITVSNIPIQKLSFFNQYLANAKKLRQLRNSFEMFPFKLNYFQFRQKRAKNRDQKKKHVTKTLEVKERKAINQLFSSCLDQ